MNEQPRNVTKAENGLAAVFADSRSRLPGGPAVLAGRNSAFADFLTTGLPHRRIEAWKYTDLRTLMRQAAPSANEASSEAISALMTDDPLSGVDRARIVVANGHYRPELSDLEGLDGVGVEDLADVLELRPDAIAAPSEDRDSVVLLNSALAQGGVVISVAANADPVRALEIAHLTTAGEPVAVMTI